MTRIEKLKKLVCDLYESENPNRAEMAEWIYRHHMLLVAAEAAKIAERFGVDKDLSVASALLHDVADAVMDRFDDKHEEESFRIARDLLIQSGFSGEEISVVVDDAMKYHSCYSEDKSPKTDPGKVLATADAIVHITSTYYPYLAEKKKAERPGQKMIDWLLPKIERDYNLKIQFPEIKVEIQSAFEKRKNEIRQLNFPKVPMK